MVGRRWENFGGEKRWKKKKHAGKEDGIFVHSRNGFNGLIRNWCIGACWFTPAQADKWHHGIALYQIAFKSV